MDWNDASDKEILTQLRNAELASRLENSEEWKLIHETMRRIYEKTQKALQDADPRDSEHVLNLQLICKMYDEAFLPQIIRNFQSIAEFAFEEAKRRNLLQRFLDSFK